MNSTIDEQTNLDEPHFDEEATILAARPVVPLEEVRTAKRSKSVMALVLAVGGGLLIGLLSAALLFRYLTAPANVDTTAAAEQPVNQNEKPVELVAGGAAAVTEEPATVTRDEKPPVEPEETPEVKRQETATARRPEPAPKVDPQPRIVTRDRRVSQDDEEEVTRADRRAERQEERRERRRAARRQQQRDEVDGNDDLSRIREIFEGSPRP